MEDRQLARWIAACAVLAWAAPAPAATWFVDSTADGADALPGDGTCADAMGRCTLRAAVSEAARPR